MSTHIDRVIKSLDKAIITDGSAVPSDIEKIDGEKQLYIRSTKTLTRLYYHSGIFTDDWKIISSAGSTTSDVEPVVFSKIVFRTTVTADAAATDSTLTLDNVTGLEVGYYWDDGVEVSEIDETNKVVTLTGGTVGAAISNGGNVVFHPLYGESGTVVVPEGVFAQPVTVYIFGYLGSDVSASNGKIINNKTFHTVVEAPDGFWTNVSDHDVDGTQAVLGLLIKRRPDGRHYQVIYTYETNTISLLKEGTLTAVPYINGIVISS